MPRNNRPDAVTRGVGGAITGTQTGVSLATLLGVASTPFAIGFGAAGLLFGIFGAGEEKEDERERQRNLEKGSIGPARYVYGTARISGDRKALEYNAGGDNISLYRWALLTQGESEGIVSMWINGIHVALRPELLPTPYPNTDDNLMPGVIGRRMGITAQYRSGSRRYVIGASRIPVPESDFYDDPVDSQLRTVSWVFQDNTRTSIQGTPSAAFGSTTQGGFAEGPNLRDPAAFSIILRRAGRVERFPFSSIDPVDPHVFLVNAEQIEWLVSIGNDTTEEWDLALIRNSEFPTSDWEQVFNTPSEVPEPTGALVPDSPFLFRNDHKLPTPYLRIFPYFNADGEVPNEAKLAAPAFWTESHRLDGIAWCLVQMNAVPRPTESTIESQNEAGFWGAAPEENVPPTIDFEVRGTKIKLPWQREAEWTDNAAACVYHYMTTRMNITDSLIDEESLREAVRICDEPRFVDLPEVYTSSGQAEYAESQERRLRQEQDSEISHIFRGYRQTTKRFAVNGLHYGRGEDPERVLRELVRAMAGSVTFEDGAYHIRAAGQRRSKWIITESDIVGEPEKLIDHSGYGSIGAVRLNLLQSRDHEYTEAELLPRFNHLAPEGEWVELGTRRFVNNALQGGDLQELALRRAQSTIAVSIEVTPGAMGERIAMRLGDHVQLIAHSINETGDEWVLAKSTSDGVSTDGNIRLTLIPDIDWSAGFTAPPLPIGKYTAGGTPVNPPSGGGGGGVDPSNPDTRGVGGGNPGGGTGSGGGG